MSVSHVEEDPALLNSSNVHAVGLCTGLLPASALVCAKTPSQLHAIGLELVALSLRLEQSLLRRSRDVESLPGTWAYSIIGLSDIEIQNILTAFHAAEVGSAVQINASADLSRQSQVTNGHSSVFRLRHGIRFLDHLLFWRGSGHFLQSWALLPSSAWPRMEQYTLPIFPLLILTGSSAMHLS